MKGDIFRFLARVVALIIVWALLFSKELTHSASLPYILVSCAIFFTLYFLSSVWSWERVLHTAGAVVVSLLHYQFLSEENIYPFLIYYYLLWESLYLKKEGESYAGSIGILLISLLPYLGQNSILPLIFHLFLAGLFIVVGIRSNEWYRVASERRELYLQLTEEYQRLKRQVYAHEQHVRAEERNRIARDMHDSVGHKLTALLMQIEILRQQSGSEQRELITTIKELAKESLSETRRAVQALNESEIEGLASVWHLIRRLETESQIRVNFSARQGVLSVPLSPEKCVVIYRSIQESLTNAMRHAFAGEVEVVLDVPGEKCVRFYIANRIRERKPFHEGFGLKSLRERVQNVGGQVEIFQTEKHFVVRGTIPLDEKRAESL